MPRARSNSGLPGLGQESFPAMAREIGRDLGLYDEIFVHKYENKEAGGSPVVTYTKAKSSIRGRIDAAGTQAPQVVASIINESSTHIVSLDPQAAISENDRLEVVGKLWRITAVREWTDELISQVEVREV